MEFIIYVMEDKNMMTTKKKLFVVQYHNDK